MFEIGYKINDLVEHDELCKRIGCGCMGGVRYSKKNNVVLLFMKKTGKYENSWNGDVLEFMGSGLGDQTANSKSNRRITESKEKGTDLFLFEWVDSSKLRFLGRMILDGAPKTVKKKNNQGEDERKVIFRLKKTK